MAALMKNRALSLAVVLVLAASSAAAQTYRSEEHPFTVTRVLSGLSHPWALAFLPDGRLLITERDGRMRVAKDGKLEAQPLAGLPQVTPHGQGGLMDVVLHPNYAQNQLIYWSYSARGSDGVGTEVARGKLLGNKVEGAQVIFRQSPKGGTGRHFGSRLVFDRA
ncbi:MAG: PQQ-dependent sugar dehydrogenase, partial [Betaproteobacteria bacterium]|nr:PQQ-dependent sugar dehydrogenase [Betaproteobacteria bacterium]